jgi:hypothetical protein
MLAAQALPAEDAAAHVPGVCTCAGCMGLRYPAAVVKQTVAQKKRAAEVSRESLAVARAAGGDALNVPVLNSRPGAPDILFLDFNGNAAFTWNNRNAAGTLQATAVHGPGGNNVPVPAFSLDADLNNFSEWDLDAIQQIWRDVAGKYAMFNVNVTTVDPNSRADGVVVHVLFGGSDDDWNNGNNGGIASIGAYNESNEDNTCFVFSRDLNVYNSTMPVGGIDENFLMETAAHEAGHVYGLTHQRQGNGGTPNVVVAEYYTGDAKRIPVMGAANSYSGFSKRQIWWKTNMEPGQKSPDTIVDDLNVLDNAGLDYAADDYNGPTTPTTALAIINQTSTVSQPGIINSVLDQDAFRFTAGGPIAQFQVDSQLDGDMLACDISLRAYPSFATISSGVTVSRGTLSATLSVTGLSPGTSYAIVVSGRFTDIGDLGGYNITGTTGAFAAFNANSGHVDVFGYGNLNNNIHVRINSGGGMVITNTLPSGTGTFIYPAFETSGLDIFLGTGSDIITVEKLGPFPAPVTVNGGGGTNTLKVQGSVTTANSFTLTGNRIVWAAGSTTGGGTVLTTMDTANVNVEVYGGNTGNAFIARNTWLPGGPALLRFFGGSAYDEAYVDDSANTVGRDWGVSGDDVVLRSGGGNTVAFTYSGTETLYFNGGSGDDSVTLGDDQHVVDSLASIQFLLSGGAGYDHVTYDDAQGRRGGGADDNYLVRNGRVVHNIADIADYQLSDVFYDDFEAYHLNLPTRDTASTTVEVQSLEAGTIFDIVGGAGGEAITIGTPGDGLADVNGAVYVYGAGSGGDELYLDGRADTLGRTVHIDPSYVNAAPGDDFFGAGGYLYYTGFTGPIHVLMGSGVDAAYVVPGPATIDIQAGAQNRAARRGGTGDGAPAGDTLGLALATVSGVAFTPGASGSGSYQFDNAQPVTYSGIESVTIDDVAPAVADAQYMYDAPVPSVDVTFNEDVAASFLTLGSYWLVLTNTTTGEEISYAEVAAEYDPATNVARFTLPAGTNGQFPDGEYAASIRAGLADAFGNVLAADASFEFFVLAGDANRDRTVGFADLVTLAQSYNQAGHSFSGANFDYSPDGLVDFDDLVILAQRYNQTLPAPLVALLDSHGALTVSGKGRRVIAEVMS